MQKTDKTGNKALDAPFNMPTQSDAKDPGKDLPVAYNSSWKYNVEMQTKKGKSIARTYFLEPSANYQGIVMGDVKSDMFIVMNFDKQMMLTLMEAGGSKIGQAISVYSDDFADETEKLGDYEIISLASQTIAGYHCKGLQMKNKEY